MDEYNRIIRRTINNQKRSFRMENPEVDQLLYLPVSAIQYCLPFLLHDYHCLFRYICYIYSTVGRSIADIYDPRLYTLSDKCKILWGQVCVCMRVHVCAVHMVVMWTQSSQLLRSACPLGLSFLLHEPVLIAVYACTNLSCVFLAWVIIVSTSDQPRRNSDNATIVANESCCIIPEGHRTFN